MPSIRELLSLADYMKMHPATELPATVSDFYWSSTTYQYNPSDAWGVNFFGGYVGAGSKAGIFYVRAVRGGSKLTLIDQITILRTKLQAFQFHHDEHGCDYCPDDIDATDILADTEQAANQFTARVRREERDACVAALQRLGLVVGEFDAPIIDRAIAALENPGAGEGK
jgi:hypothetical protein